MAVQHSGGHSTGQSHVTGTAGLLDRHRHSKRQEDGKMGTLLLGSKLFGYIIVVVMSEYRVYCLAFFFAFFYIEKID